MTAICVVDSDERPGRLYTEWEHNQWRSIHGGDTILRKSVTQGFRSGHENRTRNLRKELKMFRYETLRCTYVHANVKTEHNGLYIDLLG
jgi:hypothetical protein